MPRQRVSIQSISLSLKKTIQMKNNLKVFPTQVVIQRSFIKIGVVKIFLKFIGKHMYQILLKKRLQHRCFPVNFVKFLITPFLQNVSGRLLLSKLTFQTYLIIRPEYNFFKPGRFDMVSSERTLEVFSFLEKQDIRTLRVLMAFTAIQGYCTLINIKLKHMSISTIQNVSNPTNCFSVFGHFVGLALKGLNSSQRALSCLLSYVDFSLTQLPSFFSSFQ